MPTSPYDFIRRGRDMRFATRTGTDMHERLRKIVIDDATARGDAELIARIQTKAPLAEYFGPRARTEVAVAGTINGRFISRRIDRMIVDTAAKTIKILDYKTDTDRRARRDKYKTQLQEYRDLLGAIYPGFTISAAILWTHDWTLEII